MARKSETSETYTSATSLYTDSSNTGTSSSYSNNSSTSSTYTQLNSAIQFPQQNEIQIARLQSSTNSGESLRSLDKDRLGVGLRSESEPPTIVPTNTAIESGPTRRNGESQSQLHTEVNIPVVTPPESSRPMAYEQVPAETKPSSFYENIASKTAMDSVQTGSQASRINQGSLHARPFSPASSDRLQSIADLSVEELATSRHLSIRPTTTERLNQSKPISRSYASKSNVASVNNSESTVTVQNLESSFRLASRQLSWHTLHPRKASDTERSTTLISAFEDQTDQSVVDSKFSHQLQDNDIQTDTKSAAILQSAPKNCESVRTPSETAAAIEHVQPSDKKLDTESKTQDKNVTFTSTDGFESTDPGGSLLRTSAPEGVNTPVGAQAANLSQNQSGSSFSTASVSSSSSYMATPEGGNASNQNIHRASSSTSSSSSAGFENKTNQ